MAHHMEQGVHSLICLMTSERRQKGSPLVNFFGKRMISKTEKTWKGDLEAFYPLDRMQFQVLGVDHDQAR